MMATGTADQPPKVATAPLRRATYVNVDKLVRSQYDIDLQRLTDELAKLKAKNEAPKEVGDNSGDGTNDEGGGVGDSPGGGSGPTKRTNAPTNAWAGTNLSVLPGGPLRLHPKYHHQSRLQPPRDGFNLCLLLGKVELVVDKYRVDGSRVLVAEVEVGDETGSISLRARDEQIDLLRQVSDDGGAIVLRNCTMELYQGKHLRLAVSKWGKMSVYPDGIESTPNPPSSMNQDLNFSLVDLNIIAQSKLPGEPSFPVPVATVHHKPQKHHQQHAPKHFDESPGRGGQRNRSRSQGGGGGGQYAHQKKKKDDWQYHRGGSQHQRRPRSGSHTHASNQYLLQHQQSGGSASSPTFVPQQPQMHYQQYNDASSVYSYPSQQGGDPQQPPSPHRQQQQQHGQFLSNDHYKRQQHILYQQYELQQRHAHQMQMLQQQHESQRRMLEQQQAQIAHTSLIPDLSRVDSHDAAAAAAAGSGEYSVSHTPVGAGMVPPPPPPPSMALGPGGAFPPSPNPSPHQAMPPPQHEYQYGSLVSSPMGNVFQGGEAGQQQPPHQQQQPPRGGGVSTYATIISPPMSPAHGSHPAPQAPPQYPDGRLDGQYNPENKE